MHYFIYLFVFKGVLAEHLFIHSMGFTKNLMVALKFSMNLNKTKQQNLYS